MALRHWAPPPGAVKWKKEPRPKAILNLPRCLAECRRHRIDPMSPKFDDYLIAISISERWSDETLIRLGGVNFWTMDGASILRRFEEILMFGR